MERIFIVAEIGCNHNGSKDLAKKMILTAKECGVDAVKFQVFKASSLISKYAPKADYQIATTGESDTQLEMTSKLELSYADIVELKEYAESLGLIAFSTPFDIDSIKFLCSIGQNLWKIPSGEITNLPYLEMIGAIKCSEKKIILSTGMASKEEIKTCINVLKNAGTKEEELVLLHCNTEYPTPDYDVNILAINDLKKSFPNISVGFSDHSEGCVAAIAASAIGISLIEKHFTLDKNFPGPDHKASVNPNELMELVKNVRRVESMLGDGRKKVTESELKNKIVARKSIVALRDIKKGEFFTPDNITCKRPGNGISPMQWYDVIGKEAQKDFLEDELIELEGVYWQQ
ncbi:N-acetylneuraminate synthase [Pseudobutyrivibrio sp.]|uniref:N-acetylneuraminate synthase n=1 Tax=Pseudobutyrivibrio sp. TaxID=2014367 RepID=UPI001DCFF3FD|nr:N-acetylneuraminate synthase [Pseudobutyrivibrio sp.]MBE5910044.1 N-acetylneuraminate synthase [Pseudobutyrivibrio sp.]